MTTTLTPQAKFEVVRQKCIAANPSITDLKIGCRIKRESDEAVCIVTMDHDFAAALVSYWHPTVATPAPLLESEFEIIGRPVRLADVLLAIHDAGISCFHDATDSRVQVMDKLLRLWNLNHDDLDWHAENIPEAIDFLHSLLSNDPD